MHISVVGLVFGFVIGAYDFLNKRMSDNVLCGKLGEMYIRYAMQDFNGFIQAGFHPFGQIGLADIASDDYAGVFTHTGQEHLHLGAG